MYGEWERASAFEGIQSKKTMLIERCFKTFFSGRVK